MDAARRWWLQACVGGAVSGASAAWALAPAGSVQPGRRLSFPQDHGAHPAARTEWWYLTGFLAREAKPGDATKPMDAPAWGFQITFFRSRTGLAGDLPGRLAPRQLLFAHAALTTLGSTPRHQHAQRLGRWNGVSQTARDHARLDDAELHLGGWREGRCLD
jgi:predicted secreted hydrolase